MSHKEELLNAASQEVPESRFHPSRTADKIGELNSAHHYTKHGDQIGAWRASRGV